MKIMSKLLAAILVASVLFASAAFAETEEAADLLTRVLSVVSDADDLIELYEEDLEELMGIEPDDCADFAYLAPRDALSGREVIVILAVDEEAAERVAALLQNYLEGRRTETKNYLPEAYSLLSEAEVVREGCLVMLVIGEQADEEIRLLTAEE